MFRPSENIFDADRKLCGRTLADSRTPAKRIPPRTRPIWELSSEAFLVYIAAVLFYKPIFTQPLRRYVAQADGKLCGYCKEDLCNTENGRMIVELYLGKQEHHVSRILY